MIHNHTLTTQNAPKPIVGQHVPTPPVSVTGSPVSRVDQVIGVLTSLTVVGLAGVAGALSYSHMHQLAQEHGEQGWRAHSFPLSVDGIELVASLVLLAHRRTGTRAGVLPWAALVAGSGASLAANVAVASSDLIGRAVAGWPALALLVAIKLLAGLLDTAADPGLAVEPRPRPSGPSRGPSGSGPRGGQRTDGPSPDGDADLLAAARTVAAELATADQQITRDRLTRGLRQRGHSVSNARASQLLTRLRQPEDRPIPFQPVLSGVNGGDGDV